MDVVGFGALNVDKIYKVSRIPKPDEEAFVKDVEVYPGGSAANTIVGLSRLKLKTGYIGKVGNDEDGKFLLEDLRKECVDTHQVIKADGRSGNALIFVDEEGNRAILVDPGVNDTISYDEIDLDYVLKFRLLHLTSFVCKLSDESFKSQKKLAEEFGGEISFDPGTIYAEKGLKELKPILKRMTIFMPNRSEIETLAGLSYREASWHLIDLGVEVVVVKLGKEGCYITDGKREITIPAFEVKVVDTTGAGDAFNVGFLYGYLKGRDLEECGKLGNFVASMCVQKFGARAGLPDVLEI
jgi:ribokinase